MIKTLIGIRLSSMFSAMTGRNKDGSAKKRSVGRIVLMSLLYLYVAAAFIGLFTLMAISMAPVLLMGELEWLYFAVFTLIAFAVVFIFSIFETKSELFECKDNELLLSMPISPRHIVISRIFTVLIYNYVECALVMLPAIVVYAVIVGSLKVVLGAITVTLSVPLLATSLASAVGYLVAMISKHIKRKSLVTTLISFLFLGLYFWGYSALMSASGSEGEIDLVALSESLAAFRVIGLCATLHPICTPALIAVSALAAFVAYRVISHSYIGIVTDNRGAGRIKYVEKHLERKSALYALSIKEIRRFFSSSTYILNCGLGLVFSAIISVVALVKRAELNEMITMLAAELNGLDIKGFAASLTVTILISLCSMTMISACSLSLEGKSLWILRSMPISGKTVLLAKSMPHIIISLPFTLVSSVLLGIAIGAPLVYWPFIIVTPILATLFTAFFGTVMNTALPKFEFVNEAQPIKQSLPVFIIMISLLLYGLISVGITLVLSIFVHPVVASLAVLLLTAALTVAAYLVLIGPSARRFESLSA